MGCAFFRLYTDTMLHYIAVWDEFERIFAHFPGTGAVDGGCPANNLVKAAAKRAKAFETNREADLGDTQISLRQEELGMLDPFAREVCMRRCMKGTPKCAQEVVTRKMGNTCEFSQIEWLVELRIDQGARPLKVVV